MKHIKLDDEAHRVAKTAAAQGGMSMSAWIAEAIKAARPEADRGVAYEVGRWKFCPACGGGVMRFDYDTAADEPRCASCERPWDACPCEVAIAP